MSVSCVEASVRFVYLHSHFLLEFAVFRTYLSGGGRNSSSGCSKDFILFCLTLVETSDVQTGATVSWVKLQKLSEGVEASLIRAPCCRFDRATTSRHVFMSTCRNYWIFICWACFVFPECLSTAPEKGAWPPSCQSNTTEPSLTDLVKFCLLGAIRQIDFL